MAEKKPTRKLKVAFLGNQIAYGGGAKSLLLLLKSIQWYNIETYLYVTHISSSEMKCEFEKFVAFVKLIDLPEIVSAQTESIKENFEKVNPIKKNSEEIFALINELNELQIDILHINNSVFSPIYKIIKENTKVKIITHVREWITWNGIHSKQEFIINEINQYSDAIICISPNEAQPFLKHPNCIIIPNPFDFDVLIQKPLLKEIVERKYNIDPDWFLVGMISSFQQNKGILDFLKALNYLKNHFENIENVKFIFIGQDLKKGNPLKYYLKKILRPNPFLTDVIRFISEKNLKNDILFLPNTRNVNELINLFDIAIRPSYSGDPWGRDIIEYMALKKPIIATGSSEFYIINEVTGILVPIHDIAKLAENIYDLYIDKNKRELLGENAFNFIIQKCNIEIFSQKIISTYQTVNE